MITRGTARVLEPERLMPLSTIMVLAGWLLGLWCASLLVYWSMALWLIRLANRSMPRVRAGLDASPPEGGQPLVSIIIPAHNEEQFIDHALTMLRGSRYPALEIIIAADRCTDRTAEIVRRHIEQARPDAQAPTLPGRGRDGAAVKLVEINECPDGWSGKCHASWRGAQEARGEWLLFADADTTFHPDLVRAAVGLASRHRLDFLSLLGTLSSSRPFERTAQPVAAISLMTMYPIHRANRNDRPGRRPFANGQFMLFRRAAYEAVGTHEKIRDAILEDLRFARRLDFLGHRMGLVLAEEMFKVRMYESMEEFDRGWRRIFIEAANRNVPRLLSHVWRLRLLAASPAIQAAALALGAAVVARDAPLGWSLILLASASLLVQLLALGRVYAMQGLPWSALWRFPLGCVQTARVFRHAAADLRHERGIEWAAMRYHVREKAE